MPVCNRCYEIVEDPCRNDTERLYCPKLTREPKKRTPMTHVRKTYFCGSYKLVLDSSEIYPDDPGNGAPAMLHCGKRSATYYCAADTGDLDELEMPPSVMKWLDRMADTVAKFIEDHSPKGE